MKEETIETTCLCTICKVATLEELRSYKSDPNAPWEFLAHPSCAYQLGLVECLPTSDEAYQDWANE